MFKNNPRSPRLCDTHFLPHETTVQPHLAYDIRDVDELTKQGKSISMPSLDSMYYEGSENCTPDVPLDMQRGVNINDVWLASENAKDKLSHVRASKFQINPLKS